jgi:3-dehydroquinate synthase
MASTIIFPNEAHVIQLYLQHKEIVIIADARTNGFCLATACKYIPALQDARIITIPAGEENKNLLSAEWIWMQMQSLHVHKDYVIVNLGGGTVTDIGGFCASTFMRGIPFINIPTSLLAMNDAAFGGKTGINFMDTKNTIGTFANAEYVFIHPDFLNTLSPKQIANGAAESIKHALIHDKKLWELYKNATDFTHFTNLENIQQSIAIKNYFVQLDPLDVNERQSLNFGHSIGHAIESISLNSNNILLHGEAILLGMLAELQLSETIYNCPAIVRKDVEALKNRLYPTVKFTFSKSEILEKLLFDKKNTDTINFSLLKNIAAPMVKTKVSKEQVLQALSIFDA